MDAETTSGCLDGDLGGGSTELEVTILGVGLTEAVSAVAAVALAVAGTAICIYLSVQG